MSHYFDEAPASASAPRTVLVDVPGARFELATDRGVFSHGRLDPGTEVLLRYVPRPPAEGALVDLGCGTGAIAVTMALRSPGAEVWAVDVNVRARELCAANAARLGLTNVRVLDPDEVPADLAVAAMWSNPPIRIGKPALHELLSTWLRRLVPGARAHLVVHRHLGSDSLQRWLIDEGFPADRLRSVSGYRLFEVTARRPRTTT